MEFRTRNTSALLCGISLLSLSAALAPSALAQQAQTLDTITVTATKTEEKAIDSLAAVSTIRQEQADQLMAKKTSDLFMGIPGVWFQERADDPGTAISIRGLQDFGRVAVVIDGARQNFQRTGHNADGLFYFEPELMAGADIVRGPVANIYGSGAIGGVVSFHTKDADDILKPGERFGVLANGMYGWNGPENLTSVFAAARGGPVDIMVGTTNRDKGNYWDARPQEVLNSSSRTETGIGKITVRPAEGHEFKYTGQALETNFNNGTPVINRPTGTGAATVYDTHVQNYIQTGRWKYHRADDNLFDFEGTYYKTKTDVGQTKWGGTNSTISGRLGSLRSFTIETNGFDVHNTSRFNTGPLRHALTYGGDQFKDQVVIADPSGLGDLFTPTGERTVGGAFAQLKTNFSTWLELITALRYDEYRMRGGSATSEGDRLSPKFTLGITPVQWLTVYGTYAEGYRAPAVTEAFVSGQHPFLGVANSNFTFLTNQTLRPEIDKTKEAGVNIRHENLFTQGDGIRIKANVFENNVDSYIEQTIVQSGATGAGGSVCPVVVPAAYCIQYQNVAKAHITGAEIEGMYDAGAYFVGFAGSYIRGKNLENGQPLLKIPPHQFTTTVGARFLDRKLTVALRWQAVDSKQLDELPVGTSIVAPTWSYNLVNLYAGYQPHEDVLMFFGIDNLLNEFYARYLDQSTVSATTIQSYSPGITYKASMKVRFGMM